MTRKKKIIYWISTLWLALGMLSTALVQLFNGKTGAGGADSLARLGYPVYLPAILGVWKILGTIAILVPRLPLLKEWAYAGFFFAMSGAAVSHIIAGTGKEIFPCLLLLALTGISWYCRPADRKIISSIHKQTS